MIQLFQTFHLPSLIYLHRLLSWSCFLSFLLSGEKILQGLYLTSNDDTWRHLWPEGEITGSRWSACAHRTSTRSGRRWMIVINQDRIQSAVDQKPCSDYIIMRACRRGEDWSRARGISWRCAAWITRRPDACPSQRVRVTRARGAGRRPSQRVVWNNEGRPWQVTEACPGHE